MTEKVKLIQDWMWATQSR